jgi:hypothetical protein
MLDGVVEGRLSAYFSEEVPTSLVPLSETGRQYGVLTPRRPEPSLTSSFVLTGSPDVARD